MAKYWGEYSGAKLAPKWESQTKAGNDKTGPRRGNRCVDPWGDNDEFMHTANPKADREFFGTLANGAQRVTSTKDDPGALRDQGKGAKGADADDDSYGLDDGVRY